MTGNYSTAGMGSRLEGNGEWITGQMTGKPEVIQARSRLREVAVNLLEAVYE
jgi:hypothetical protein